MKKIILTLLLSFFCSALWGQTCHETMDELRAKQLSRLLRIEEDFMRASWHYRKNQEIIYTPLWQAGRDKDKSDSKQVRAEGAVAYERYRQMADREREKAHEFFKRANQNMKALESGLPKHFDCQGTGIASQDPISDFRNCMEIFNEETGARLSELRALLAKFYKDQETFTEMVESHYGDTLSDHDTFEDRFNDYLYLAQVRTTSRFLSVTRDLENRFERLWPGVKCCDACLADRTFRHDAVLEQVKPDPQGMSGVAGNLVNNARLTDAFKRFDENGEDESEDQTRS